MSATIQDRIMFKLRAARRQNLQPRGIYLGYREIDELRLSGAFIYVTLNQEATFYGVPVYQVNVPSHLEVRSILV